MVEQKKKPIELKCWFVDLVAIIVSSIPESGRANLDLVEIR